MDEPQFYVLDSDNVVQPATLMVWARFFEDSQRRIISKTRVGDAEVSTIFLGIDYRFGAKGRPLVFETMIFGGPRNHHTQRYATYRAAVAGHKRLVKLLGGDIGRHE